MKNSYYKNFRSMQLKNSSKRLGQLILVTKRYFLSLKTMLAMYMHIFVGLYSANKTTFLLKKISKLKSF